MGLGGGGGGGTTTQVVNNVPFNAQELKTVQDNAIGLLGSNPFQYYPGQTYAGPSDQQTFGYPRVGNLGINSGDLLAGLTPDAQFQALATNNGYAAGDNYRTADPYINQLQNLSSSNLLSGNSPSQQSLQNIGTGSNFGPVSDWAYSLGDISKLPGYNNLVNTSYNGYFNGIQPTISALNNITANNSASGVAQGNFFDGAMPAINSLASITDGNPASSVANGNYYNYGVGGFVNPLASSGTTGPGAQNLQYLANGGGFNNLNPYTGGLTQLASNSPELNALQRYGSGNTTQAAIDPYAFSLSGQQFTPAGQQLSSTAQGQYLNSNPYLDATFKAASDPLVNAFQTAIAPTIDSRMAAAGRFNSGSTANSQSVAQQNLGKSLADLSAGIYEPAYENERNRQIQAAGTAENANINALSNAGGLVSNAVNQLINSATNAGSLQNTALSNAGNLTNQQTGQQLQAATNAEAGYQSGYSNAGNLYKNLVDQITNAGLGLGQLKETGLTNSGNLIKSFGDQIANTGLGLGNLAQTGLTNAGNLYNNSAGQAIQATEALMNQAQLGLVSAGNLYNAGTAEQSKAAAANAGLNIQDVNSQGNLLTSALGNIYNFGNQQQAAAGATPNLTQMPFADYQAAISAGSAQQQLQQQALQDAQNRFYGTQQAPYNNLASVAGIIGGAIPGSAATTTPFFTNPLGQITGGIGAANSLFGNNGLLNGAFGGSGIGALGTGAINSELASGLGLSGASAIPFTDFAGSAGLTDALTGSIAATAPVAADAGASAASFLPFLAK